MIPVTQLRQNVSFLLNNEPYKVMVYSHTHMGRGGGTIKVKIKNLHSGATLERTFKSGDRVEEIEVDKRQVQYLYQDGDELIFMDESSYEQFPVKQKVMGESSNYLREGSLAWLQVWVHGDTEEILDVNLPASMIFRVAEAAPNEKGNSASNMYKDGILENGVKVRIPLFVNAGEEVKINTEDGSYVGRA